MVNYWIVGATVQKQDMTDDFIRHGFWFADAPDSQGRIEDIAIGDRIAIKRLRGQGETTIDVKALGVVRGVGRYHALNFRIVFVDWIPVANRQAPHQGLVAAVNGPYAPDKLPVSVFQL